MSSNEHITPTHKHPNTLDFYESEFVVEDGEIKYYKIVKDNVWRSVDRTNKYERHPKIKDLVEI